MLFLLLADEPHPISVPERVEKACNQVTYRKTDERKANLPEIESVVVAKHQRESTETEVKDS